MLLLLFHTCALVPPALIAISTSLSQAGTLVVKPNNNQVEEVLELLASMPDWPLLPAISDMDGEKEARRQAQALEKIAQQISEYDTEILRQAFMQYQARNTNIASLYLLNKYLFRIPTTVRRDSKHFRKLILGGWSGLPRTGTQNAPMDDDEFSVLWPWREDDNGRLRFIVDQRARTYMGPPYPAIDVFDYSSKEFCRRATHGEKKKNKSDSG